MLKRNEGYALTYVLVVLMVLAIIATAVMAPPLRNLQMQQASIERMQEKYIAQGMIEQVVAQLEKQTERPSADIIEGIKDSSGTTIETTNNTDTYTITAISDGTTVSAKIILTAITKTTNNGETETTETVGYSVAYESYEISYNTGGGE